MLNACGPRVKNKRRAASSMAASLAESSGRPGGRDTVGRVIAGTNN
jgi:hypothetical protein